MTGVRVEYGCRCCNGSGVHEKGTGDCYAASTLDAAWAEVERALPEGWWIHDLHAWSFDDMAYRAEAVAAGSQEWVSTAQRDKLFGTRRYVHGPTVDAYGPTPAAALNALAAALARRLTGDPAE